MQLQIRNISKYFGNTSALADVTLDIMDGEFVFLLGPSGCGKTTLLRIIAGLEMPDMGQIVQDGRDVTRLSPSKRDFGIVFQSYALFPNLTVAQNVAYGLQSRDKSRQQVADRVDELLELVGLSGYAKRYPSQLSGGQQQRVALVRALAISPRLLLLDEPLSALDARVRANLRVELASLQRRLGITTIMVTHDQEEALTMADRIVVMESGKAVQVGTPLEIYQQPASPFVADFVGLMNFLPGHAAGDGAQQMVRCGASALRIGPQNAPFAPGSPVTLAIRPEELQIPIHENNVDNILLTQVQAVEFTGPIFRLHLLLAAENYDDRPVKLTAYLPRDPNSERGIVAGKPLRIHVPPHSLRVYPGKVAAAG